MRLGEGIGKVMADNKGITAKSFSDSEAALVRYELFLCRHAFRHA
jgi:hypothetical protein